MSAQLCEQIALSAASPAVAQEFFSADELTTIREIDVARECPQHAVHPPTCDVNLRCGFFFDGTNNNLFNVNFFVSQYNRGKNIKLIAYFILRNLLLTFKAKTFKTLSWILRIELIC